MPLTFIDRWPVRGGELIPPAGIAHTRFMEMAARGWAMPLTFIDRWPVRGGELIPPAGIAHTRFM
ncbi:hypothetical protein, partial [Salmonella enterica]|uniref:hypothetical protein n=1 Tax=Salmonella enterica TaxID=28901 RepID=UPI00261AFCDF